MGIEFENRDEQQVSQVLASLSQVNPPGDFDVRIRSRIAAGKPAEPGSWFWPLLAGATPLVLILAVGAYFALRTYPIGSATVASAPVMEQVQVPSSPSDSAPIVVANNVSESPTSGDLIAKTPAADDRPTMPTTPVRGPNGGGRIDQTITEFRPPNPRGIGSNPRPMPKPRDFDAAISIPLTDVLTQIGVDSQGSASGVKVVSITPNGAASRLGLKENDMIESIDDKPVNEKTSYKGKFAGKKMRVIREGKSVEIDLSKP